MPYFPLNAAPYAFRTTPVRLLWVVASSPLLHTGRMAGGAAATTVGSSAISSSNRPDTRGGGRVKLARNRIAGGESLSLTMVDQHVHRYGIVGQSRAIAEVFRRIELVAASRSTVLITGETGTGKELVARAVHDGSARHALPFIKVNCAAIPETLL